ncbi:hypothetical protein EVAR_16988_1 [Eumeta japonica]|uniref:Uncharacterized protein n=1 Tax=Eumeta variegata TaxID=151549 RepID=A0A4C1TVH4_EUMVA|nr:hypothetical protein EVAR_16988_1 [Eumeta japonica]
MRVRRPRDRNRLASSALRLRRDHRSVDYTRPVFTFRRAPVESKTVKRKHNFWSKRKTKIRIEIETETIVKNGSRMGVECGVEVKTKHMSGIGTRSSTRIGIRITGNWRNRRAIGMDSGTD